MRAINCGILQKAAGINVCLHAGRQGKGVLLSLYFALLQQRRSNNDAIKHRLKHCMCTRAAPHVKKLRSRLRKGLYNVLLPVLNLTLLVPIPFAKQQCPFIFKLGASYLNDEETSWHILTIGRRLVCVTILPILLGCSAASCCNSVSTTPDGLHSTRKLGRLS